MLPTKSDLKGRKLGDLTYAYRRDHGHHKWSVGNPLPTAFTAALFELWEPDQCYAWGENITTCGDGWTGNSTNSFGGTSGATPTVTGSALNRGASSEDSRVAHPPTNSSSDRIGVMPVNPDPGGSGARVR
jgi:hypothetical protein